MCHVGSSGDLGRSEGDMIWLSGQVRAGTMHVPFAVSGIYNDN